MFLDIFTLFLGLLLILLAAEGFTNGLEVFGRRFLLSQAVVGSLLAAVGTALPETILPIVAIFFHHGKSGKDIGIGAILGAPFMLSTLAFFLVGVTVLISTLKKRRDFSINIEYKSMKRDLSFFLPMYSLALLSSFIDRKLVHLITSVILIFSYLLYVYRTFRCESRDIEHVEEMYLWKLFRRLKISKSKEPFVGVILTQVIGSIVVMVLGARIFVSELENISLRFGMNPLLFALLIAPVATELPEKFNSVTWTWKGKDTLAIGNITGAMVFQATFPVSVGILFTEWEISGMAFISAVLAVFSATLVLAELSFKKNVSPLTLLFGGLLYIFYAVTIISVNN
jgi:cation:H+ antiporter